MHILWCLLLGLLMYAGASQAEYTDGGLSGGNRCNKYSNGCSIVNGFPYKTQFTPACYRHDVCYGCGARFGKSRLVCDNAFRSDMRKICRDQKLPSNCLSTADLYYNGVRLGGSLFYRNPSVRYCSESWVKSCLP